MLINQADWEKTFSGYCKGDVLFNAPMRDLTNLGIGGPADVVVSPQDPVSMKNVVMLLSRQGVPFLCLGSGTNILVRDSGIEGVVIRLKSFGRVEVLKETDEFAELFVEAGVLLQKLVNLCREKGYSGIEGLTGIPGTVGGALCGNAGSYGCEIKDVLISLVMMRPDGSLERFRTEELGFGYRSSGITAGDIVLSANLRMKRDNAEAVALRTDFYFSNKKTTQPIWEKSAGCVFRNPAGMSAGRLIDEAGCKGMRIGDIEVSQMHANFFVNRGEGTAADYLTLMDTVSAKVSDQFGVTLEPEIRVIGKG